MIPTERLVGNMIDYNEASKTYDNTRNFSDVLIDHFASKLRLTKETVVLDFGCGTGNYLNRIQERFGCRCYGVEPSEGMRTAASKKNPTLDIRQGDHRQIPFADESFDFVFMTDVVHHIPDLSSMFLQLRRVMKSGAFLCVVTESHTQIEGRFYNRYFPSLVMNEKRRYPDVLNIIEIASNSGFEHDSSEIRQASPSAEITEDFVRNVEEKNFSMFRGLSEKEFLEGLKRLKSDVGKSLERKLAGETWIWLKKHALQ